MFYPRPISFLSFALIVIDILGSVSTQDHEWCYSRPECAPETWPGICKDGLAQSPVNLVPSRRNGRGWLETWNVGFSRDYCEDHEGFFVQNNDHTLEVRLDEKSPSSTHVMSGQGFNGEYVFSQLHFHWGSNDRVGSEHTLFGKRFPMEMHLVHSKSAGRGKFVEPGTGSDSLAVLGVFFEVDTRNDRDNPGLTPIIEAMEQIEMSMPETGTYTWINNTVINLFDFIPPKREIFRYTGSLTTPGCAETVIWTVFRQPLTISRRQLKMFRDLKTSHGELMSNNYRPTQPLNRRWVVQKIFSSQRNSGWTRRDRKRKDKHTNININIRYKF